MSAPTLSEMPDIYAIFRGVTDPTQARHLALDAALELQRRLARLVVAREALEAATEFGGLVRRLSHEIADMEARIRALREVALSDDPVAALSGPQMR